MTKHDRNEVPALPTRDRNRWKVPAPVSRLVDRETEMAAVVELVQTRRLVTITGPPGVGKTRLAMAAADDLEHHFADGVPWVDLVTGDDHANVAKSIASVLSVGTATRGPVLPKLVQVLAESHVLLVLDTCEHVLAISAEVAERILSNCPEVSILATSCQPLGVPGESVFRLQPLPLPEADTVAAGTTAAAVRLFWERAQAVRADLSLNEEVAVAVAAICRRLEGVPLALELAAGRLDALSPAQVANLLEDDVQLLVSAGRAHDPRHRSWEAALEWHYGLLSADEQTLFRRLSVFVGGCTPAAALNVCGLDGLQQNDLLHLLTGLVAKSLVEADVSGPDARYRLIEPVRQYAKNRLTQAGEATDRSLAHANWWLDFRGRERMTPEALQRLAVEAVNVRSALRWAIGQGRPELALRLAWALIPFWLGCGGAGEGRRSFDDILRLLTGGLAELRCRALYGAAMFTALDNDAGAALPLAEEGLEEARRTGDERAIAWSLHVLGFVALTAGPATAVPILEESVAVARKGDAQDPSFVGLLATLGTAHCAGGDLSKARRVFEECVELAHRAGDEVAVAGHLGLGRVAVAEGEYLLAEEMLSKALAGACDRADDTNAALALCLMGEAAAARGRMDDATHYLSSAVARARGVARPSPLAACLLASGRFSLTKGEPDAARLCFEEASDLGGGRIHTPDAKVLQGLGEVAFAVGDRGRARTLLDEALGLARTGGDRPTVARCLCALGRLAEEDGDDTRAGSLHDQALREWAAMGDKAGQAQGLQAAAAVAARAGRPDAAVRLFAASHALFESLGVPHASDGGRAGVLGALREEMGEEAFTSAWAEGALMSPVDAVAYACRRRGSRTKAASGWGSLTRAERGVAILASQGLTNREIGERLFISPRTVQRHLSAVFVKLEVSSRRELSRVAEGLQREAG